VGAEAPAVLVRGLAVHLTSAPVLRGVDLEVAAGDRLAVLGPNGAGKTTLIRTLAGLVRPSAGQVTLAGLGWRRHARRLRASIGVLSHQTHLYGELTAAENLRFYGRLFRVGELDERIGALLEQVGLYGRRNQRVDSLSRGLQQRLAIARAVLHDPPILLLDEPDTGHDLPAQYLLESVLFGGGLRRTVVMATHNLEQAGRLCRRAVVLVRGRLVRELPAGEIDGDALSSLYSGPVAARR
jgi:heme exporter protein A